MVGRASKTKMGSGPVFPTFLLPSFSIPFRRRRTSSSVSSSLPPDTGSVPSLSSSPTSSDSASPTTPTTFTFPTDYDLDNFPNSKAALTPARDRRISRSQPDTLRCSGCSTDIAFGAQIVSKGFTGRHGRAYLVSAPLASASHLTVAAPHHHVGAGGADLTNVRVGRPENRQLVTGAHVVADITCVVCSSRLGWKYVDALEAAQRYKIGKFILETQRVVACRDWEDADSGSATTATTTGRVISSGGPSETRDVGRRTSLIGDDVEEVEEPGEEDDEDSEEVVVFDSEDEDECEDIFTGVWDPAVVAKRRKGKVANLRKKGGMRQA